MDKNVDSKRCHSQNDAFIAKSHRKNRKQPEKRNVINNKNNHSPSYIMLTVAPFGDLLSYLSISNIYINIPTGRYSNDHQQVNIAPHKKKARTNNKIR